MKLIIKCLENYLRCFSRHESLFQNFYNRLNLGVRDLGLGISIETNPQPLYPNPCFSLEWSLP